MEKRVLIVEDEVIHAMALELVLPDWGYRVMETVSSGEDAVRVAQDGRPDIVLMDLTLHGEMGGLAATREIVGRLGIPVICMSGLTDEETVRAVAASGPLAFLEKPLDVERLRLLLRDA